MDGAIISAAKGFANKVFGSRKKIVWRVEGDDTNGHHYWSYVLIDEPKFAAFKKALDGGNIRVQDYGKILAWGEGSNPSTDVKKEIMAEYHLEIRD